MVTIDDVKAMVDAAETDPVMMKSLKNLNISDYWVNKYYDFEVMLNAEYPALVKLWDLDLYCYTLYRKEDQRLSSKGLEGKAQIFQMLANVHRTAILDDMAEISNILHDDYDDFFGLES